mmetsp:Transcript_22262/g.48355  ORF Transcript_22262/g.48355 Transcript_22262/m.48355 type:complete len:110 (-) Transcript_22262:126-455(-)
MDDDHDDLNDDDDFDMQMKDQATIDEHRREELVAVMNDLSLSESEQTKKMKEVRAKYGIAEMKTKVAAASVSSQAKSASSNSNTIMTKKPRNSSAFQVGGIAYQGQKEN